MKNSLHKMKCLDIFLSSLPEEEYKTIKEDISDSGEKRMPLSSWDIFDQHKEERQEAIEKSMDIETVKSLAKEHQWKNNFDSIFSKYDFDALVITNDRQKIQWVNKGFTKMTGYPKIHAINKYPTFLQGELTSERTKEKIRENIRSNKPFKEVIINYKKDKTPYKCEIRVFPLYNDETTHFIALERKVV